MPESWQPSHTCFSTRLDVRCANTFRWTCALLIAYLSMAQLLFLSHECATLFGFDRSVHILMTDCAIPDVSCILVLLFRNVIAICS